MLNQKMNKIKTLVEKYNKSLVEETKKLEKLKTQNDLPPQSSNLLQVKNKTGIARRSQRGQKTKPEQRVLPLNKDNLSKIGNESKSQNA